MIEYLSFKSEKMYNYLYDNGEFPVDTSDYRFLIINFDDDHDYVKIIEFLEGLINNVIILKIHNDFIVFYFETLEIEIKDLFSSISDDFGVNLKVFSSGKMNNDSPKHFRVIYDAYKKYLYNKLYSFASITDLVLEIIKNDIRDLNDLKPAVLNKVNDDSQIEKLILAMFDNNLNVTKTANEVFMHRNTIINKLEYIKNETSLNLQNFKDAICMYWLIKAK